MHPQKVTTSRNVLHLDLSIPDLGLLRSETTPFQSNKKKDITVVVGVGGEKPTLIRKWCNGGIEPINSTNFKKEKREMRWLLLRGKSEMRRRGANIFVAISPRHFHMLGTLVTEFQPLSCVTIGNRQYIFYCPKCVFPFVPSRKSILYSLPSFWRHLVSWPT